ncbi:phosphatidate cytidylyltransferase [Sneathiella sp.]|uniref:phosphatidate cytidylyltransferase n=1 Tax=Sneathiella sp. TaxID=1964365 RepID=UPI002623A856|nr:phosphatidate cytidylyltransferase [Sneathiella sp.]MDF2368668.1 phosphatidate cytidylyltransferase [Sneathiella sp.]
MLLSSLTSLQQRVISALVLAPIAIATLYFGGVYFLLFLIGAAAIMAYEWCHASLEKSPGLATLLTGASVVIALFLVQKGYFLQGIIVLVSGAVLMVVAAIFLKKTDRMIWALTGPLCIGLPVIALIMLRGIPDAGFAVAFGLFLVIWATDIGAYFSGKSIGGPKIAPSISPNKTWAGLIGGIISAMIVAYLVNRYLMGGQAATIGVLGLGAICAILAQVGDFAESAWKRHFGIKDASNLIPGHGGVMDRLDGVFLTAPMLMVIIMIVNGVW